MPVNGEYSTLQYKLDRIEQSRLTHTVFCIYPLFMQEYLIIYYDPFFFF